MNESSQSRTKILSKTWILVGISLVLIIIAIGGIFLYGQPEGIELEQGYIKVGVLHSLSGTLAISETPVVEATLMAIDEINEQGGVLGKKIEPIVVDGASDWSLFAQEAERLITMQTDYMDKISRSRGTTLRSFISLLVESIRTINTKNQEAHNKLRDCFMRLITLSEAAFKYQNEIPTVSFRKEIGLGSGINFTEEENSRIQIDIFRISIDAMAFFEYLRRLESDVDSAIRLNIFEMAAGYKIKKSDFYTNVLHKARRQDRVYVSLWKLRFINYFKGKGIIIISALWLTCLVLGLFTLFALDKIPINVLPYLAS